MTTVAFHTLGCKVNQYETEAIIEQFSAHGYQIVGFDTRADIYIVNTCTVTNIADQKSRQMLSKAKKLNEKSVVVAVGCYVQIAHEKLEEVPFVDVLIGNTHKNQVLEIVEKFIETQEKDNYIEDVHHNIEYENLSIDAQYSKTRSTIKIQDGCNQYCSYCIIPFTRGKIRSRHKENIIEEVRMLTSKGYKEIILTGIHLASYGKELEETTLIGLIEELNAIEGLMRIRLGSLEPNFITRELLDRMVKCEKVCDHFHLSMQSGSDSVLKRMNRRYDTSAFKEKADLLREFYHNPAITTDAIVGFPMETEEEAKETLDFVEKIKFAQMHIFKYSIREGTKAAEMKPQVNGTVKSLRSKALTEVSQQLNAAYRIGFIGTEVSVLFEEKTSISGNDYYTGYTTNYIKVYVQAETQLTGMLLEVKITELFEDGIKGML